MTSLQPKVLVVDDEPDIRDLVRFNLQRAGIQVEEASDGLAALERIRTEAPDLIVLDVMLPGKDGCDVFRLLRRDSRTQDIPVLMLTAKAQLEDKIRGLELGVEDYMTKPFSPKELVLRVQGLLKRSRRPPSASLLEIGPFKLDKNHLHFFLAGERIELTPTEFKFLLLLMERQGQPQERNDLLREVWSYSDLSYSRTLDTHVRRLREKLGNYGDWVRTVRGVGYCFAAPGAGRHG